MPLINAILDMEPLGVAIFGSVFLGLILAFILIIFISIASPFFSKRFDPILFNERWFTVFELGFYTTWPFSMMKTLYYMYFISFPKFSRRKRFKDIPSDLMAPYALIVISRIYITLHLFGLLLGIIFFGVGGYVYFFYEAPLS